jgi:hypothetical protein
MTLLLLCNLCLPIRLTWSSFSTCKAAKVVIADGQTFSDSIDKKSAGNLNLYNLDVIWTSSKIMAAVSPFSTLHLVVHN